MSTDALSVLKEICERLAKVAEFEHSVGTNGIGIAAAIRHWPHPNNARGIQSAIDEAVQGAALAAPASEMDLLKLVRIVVAPWVTGNVTFEEWTQAMDKVTSKLLPVQRDTRSVRVQTLQQ